MDEDDLDQSPIWKLAAQLVEEHGHLGTEAFCTRLLTSLEQDDTPGELLDACVKLYIQRRRIHRLN